MPLDVKDKERVVAIKEQILKLNTERAELRKKCEPHPNATKINTRTINILISPSGDYYVESYRCPDCGSNFKRYES